MYGLGLLPPSGGAELRHRTYNFVQSLLCFKLDAMTVSDALSTSILNLGRPGVGKSTYPVV